MNLGEIVTLADQHQDGAIIVLCVVVILCLTLVSIVKVLRGR